MENQENNQLGYITKEIIDNDADILKDFEKQIIVHCFISPEIDMVVRIWPSTNLIGQNGVQSDLIHAMNITYAPEWTPVRAFSSKQFTLIFQALPPEVVSFALSETMAGGNRGFYVADIQRKKSDVYKIYL